MANATASACTLVSTTLVIGGTLSGTFLVGMTLSGASVPPGVTIVSQTTGPAGGAGAYVVTANSANITTAEAMTGSLSWIMPTIGNASGPQSNLLDLGWAAGFGFVVAMCPGGPTAAPGAEYTFGTHAQAIYDQNSRGTQVFPAAQPPGVYRTFAFTGTLPQYVDPPQPSIQRALVKSTEVVNPNQQTIIAAPQQHDPSAYLQPFIDTPTITESTSIFGQEYHFGTHQKAYYDSQNGTVVWPSLPTPRVQAQQAPLRLVQAQPQELGRDITQQAWFTNIPLNQGWILTFAGAGPQAYDFTNQGTFSPGVVGYPGGQAKSSPIGFIAAPQQDPTQPPAQVFRPPLVKPTSAPIQQVIAAPDLKDYRQPGAVITPPAIAGPSQFPMRPLILVPQQAYVDVFPLPFKRPLIGTFIPPPPPFVPNNCTNLWDFSGNWDWDFSGYPGWSWDGYEPTPLECAVTYLAEVGVNVGQLTYQCSSLGVPLGWVITGYVPYINPAYAGRYFPLIISNGPCPVPLYTTVPNVIGMFYYDAQLAILDAALRIAQPIWGFASTVQGSIGWTADSTTITADSSITVDSSTVIQNFPVNPQYVYAQSIPPGTTVLQGSQVTITVQGFPVVNQPGIIVPVA